MIRWFCIGFLSGVVFDWVTSFFQMRRMYIKHRNLIEPTVMKVFEEEEQEKRK